MSGNHPRVSRRAFLERLALLGALPLVGRAADALAAPQSSRSAQAPGTRATGPERMTPVRALGKTGHSVALFSLGGQATIEAHGKAREAVAIINRAIDLGVNYLDTA